MADSSPPAYDIISAYPLLAKRQLEGQNLRMAMAVKGKSSHYLWQKIMYRHWLAMAARCRFPVEEMATIIDELLEKMDDVIAAVSARLPPTFPADLGEAVFEGMRSARERMNRSKGD